MASKPAKAFPLVGVIFLALAAWQFTRGEGWVVWAILGVLFGGLGLFRRKADGGNI